MSSNQNLSIEKTELQKLASLISQELINEESTQDETQNQNPIVESSLAPEEVEEELSEDQLVKILEKLFFETLETQVANAVQKKLSQITINTVKEPVEEQSAEPAEEQSDEPVEEQSAEPAEEQSTEPVEEQSTEPVEEQLAEPVEEQYVEPVEEPKREIQYKDITPDLIKSLSKSEKIDLVKQLNKRVEILKERKRKYKQSRLIVEAKDKILDSIRKRDQIAKSLRHP